jgi:hypothetical protein
MIDFFFFFSYPIVKGKWEILNLIMVQFHDNFFRYENMWNLRMNFDIVRLFLI